MSQTFIPNPRLGLAYTLAGAALFVPDALLVRLIGANVMDVAIWRGMIGGSVTLVGTALFAPHLIPSWRVLLSWPSLLLILAQPDHCTASRSNCSGSAALRLPTPYQSSLRVSTITVPSSPNSSSEPISSA